MPSATLRERLGKLGWVSSESCTWKLYEQEKFESSITHKLQSMTILQQKTENVKIIGTYKLRVKQRRILYHI